MYFSLFQEKASIDDKVRLPVGGEDEKLALEDVAKRLSRSVVLVIAEH